MGSEGVPYAAARDFERAVVARVASAAASSPYGVPAALVFLLAERFSITKKVGMYKAQELRRQFAFGRLLARVFIHDPDRWVLKGATGLLARLPGQARHSVDVDLYFGGELDAALDALREIADVELGDYFTFDLERGPNLAGVTAGGQLRVTAYLGDKVFERFRIDVVVTHAMTSEPDQVSPIDPVNIPGLRTVDYRTHPIPDQIADKSAAMLATYAGRPSTRYRDLVDLVLIATTLTVDGEALRAAIVSEHQRRGIDPALALSLPSDEWHAGYRKIAATVPGFEIHDANQAIDIAKRLVEPIRGGRDSGRWDPSGLDWRER